MRGIPRNAIIPASILIVLVCLVVALFVWERSSRRELEALRTKQSELVRLAAEYRTARERFDAEGKRARLQQVKGIAQAVDGIVSSLGIKGRMKSLKTAGMGGLKGGLQEESAEITMEKLSLNQIVNLFSSVREAPMMLIIKRISMKKSFESPELLDVTLTLSLFTPQ